MKWIRLQIIWIAFVMFLMGFVFWRVSLGWRVNRQLAGIRAAGEPTTWPELDKWYKAVPDSENAALVLTQAFALRRTFPDQRSNQVANIYIPSRGPPLPLDIKQLLVDYLELNRATLAKMHEGLKLSKNRFPIALSAAGDLSHLARLKGLALDVRYEAILAMESDQTESAAVAIEDMLKLAGTLDDEPLMISQLVRNAIIEIATRTLERCLNTADFKAEELKRLLSAFTATEKTGPLTRGLVGERVSGVAWFQTMNLSGLTRTERMALQAVRFSGYVQRGLPPYLHTMATNLALAARGPPEWLAAVKLSERAEQEATERKEPFVFLLYDTGRSYNRFAEGFAHIRMATTVLAVERLRIANEPLPKNLDQLKPKYIAAVPADPFDGAPLRYRRIEKGYLVYSIGRDLHDDGGREVPRDSTNAMIYPVVAEDTMRRRYGLEPPNTPALPATSNRSSATSNGVSWNSNALGTFSFTNASAKETRDLTFTVER